ncbi:MAG: FxSxx-COOH system tetratricopeptide repeat protein, partial [Acidovorax sp.]|nr:FxSxx-COOH system tetratricopeptide repeat protein [Acidovorax sp.]
PAALTQAIHGLGGVGKTGLAVEYAYRHGPEYSLVWWLRSEEPVALAADYAALARELDLKEKDHPDQGVVAAAVRRWLGQHEGWLLIFDNAPAPREVAGYLPGQVLGRVLITSRNPEWGSLAAALQVPVLPPDKAVDFLLRRTGGTDRDAAARVAEALGRLPLALEQAGAYISETKMPFAKYLKLFQTRREELWGEEKTPLDYEHTVATTWSLALERIKQEAPGAGELLNVCAYLAPDDMPLALFREAKENLPGSFKAIVADDLAWNRAVAALRRYSLLEVGDEALTMHRLVQQVVQDRLTGEDRKKWAGVAVRLVNRAFPYDSDEVDNWPVCARLLPHALAAAGHAQDLQAAPAAAGRLFNQAGLYLRDRAEFSQARQAYERALAIDEAAYGPNHPEVAIDVNNLGSVLQDLGDLAGAKAHFERALAIDEAAYGPNHPAVARDVNNLGSVLKDLGDLAGAKAHFERALAIAEAAYGPNHPTVATDVNNLGGVLKELGDLAGAKAHFERALTIDEAAYGPHHPQVAAGVNNLGGVLKALGDPAGAKAHFERALTIDEAAYGPDHPAVARDVNNLGGVLKDLGDPAGARACYERAFAICKHFLGEDHPDTRLVRGNLESLG